MRVNNKAYRLLQYLKYLKSSVTIPNVEVAVTIFLSKDVFCFRACKELF